MALTLDAVTVTLVLGAVLLAVVAALAWRRREEPTAMALSAMMLSAEGWVLGVLIGDLQTGAGWQIFWGKVNFMFIPLTVTLWLVFALLYTGRDELVTTRTLFGVAMYPALVWVFVWTNDPGGLHDLFWSSITIQQSGANDWDWGPVWYANSALLYAIIVGTTVAMLREVLARDEMYRGQGITIGLAVLAPFALNVAYVTGAVETDLTPVGFAVTGASLLWGMASYGLGDVTPVAQRTLLANFSDGVVVVDDDDRVTEMNEEAKRMFGVEDESVVGDHMRAVFDHLPGFYAQYEGVRETRDEVEVEFEEPRTFDVEVSPLVDSRGETIGRLFTVHDITEQKRRERELELQNRQLDQFASLVTHEIRDPLTDVRERVENTVEDVAPEHRGELLRAKQSLDEVDELVDDVLAMARGGSVVDREETSLVNLADVADRAWWDLTNEEMPPRVTVADRDVRADPDRLQRLLGNLFENAVTYGGTDVTIEVGVVEGPEGPVGFYVEDDGPGIPEGARDSVFEAGVSGSEDSAGLGLAIVRTMAEAHDWDVSLTDGDLGGARVTVTGVAFPDDRISSDPVFESATPTDD